MARSCRVFLTDSSFTARPAGLLALLAIDAVTVASHMRLDTLPATARVLLTVA